MFVSNTCDYLSLPNLSRSLLLHALQKSLYIHSVPDSWIWSDIKINTLLTHDCRHHYLKWQLFRIFFLYDSKCQSLFISYLLSLYLSRYMRNRNLNIDSCLSFDSNSCTVFCHSIANYMCWNIPINYGISALKLVFHFLFERLMFLFIQTTQAKCQSNLFSVFVFFPNFVIKFLSSNW